MQIGMVVQCLGFACDDHHEVDPGEVTGKAIAAGDGFALLGPAIEMGQPKGDLFR